MSKLTRIHTEEVVLVDRTSICAGDVITFGTTQYQRGMIIPDAPVKAVSALVTRVASDYIDTVVIGTSEPKTIPATQFEGLNVQVALGYEKLQEAIENSCGNHEIVNHG